MAINLFFLSLILSWVGWSVLPLGAAIVGGCVLGVPATWLFARHLRKLMDSTEDNSG
ncbi:MAG: NnrT protein [Hyphomicrobiales bacterium]|nr:MAG: NnrT protein [Hyphomicrobiales bacterium]